uniref:Uncharacterized protein n=1 Tax=Rhipicephalus zambeziensis TaxID=60191 RepID=A0A224YG66_9ACAR
MLYLRVLSICCGLHNSIVPRLLGGPGQAEILFVMVTIRTRRTKFINIAGKIDEVCFVLQSMVPQERGAGKEAKRNVVFKASVLLCKEARSSFHATQFRSVNKPSPYTTGNSDSQIFTVMQCFSMLGQSVHITKF